jgi:hypothetical protein
MTRLLNKELGVEELLLLNYIRGMAVTLLRKDPRERVPEEQVPSSWADR